ncbi:hypothetical protein Hanom_Chr16g01458241 [Helianthus anomalus]
MNDEYGWRCFILDGRRCFKIISLSCLRAGGSQVFAHLGEPRSWWRSSSRPWPQRSVS